GWSWTRPYRLIIVVGADCYAFLLQRPRKSQANVLARFVYMTDRRTANLSFSEASNDHRTDHRFRHRNASRRALPAGYRKNHLRQPATKRAQRLCQSVQPVPGGYLERRTGRMESPLHRT